MDRGGSRSIWMRAAIVFAFLVAVLIIGLVPSMTPAWAGESGGWLPVYIKKPLADNTLYIAALAGLVIWVLPNPQALVRASKAQQVMRSGMLREIGQDVFNGRLGGMRITLFSEAGRFLTTWHHLLTCFRHVTWKGTPWLSRPILGRFIVIRARESSESESAKLGTSFFCHPKDRDKCEGVAAHSIRSLEAVPVEDLPDIKHINLRDFDRLSTFEQRQIAKYMERSFLSNFATLKQVSVPCRHIWSNVVYNQQGKAIGALVVDSHNDESFLTPEVDRQLATYANALKHSFVENSYA